jgi:hypothetical protein
MAYKPSPNIPASSWRGCVREVAIYFHSAMARTTREAYMTNCLRREVGLSYIVGLMLVTRSLMSMPRFGIRQQDDNTRSQL